MGRKLAMIIRVELSIGMRTSREASKMTSMTGRLPGIGSWRLSRRRLYTFSTSTMASSTSDPIAMHRPPRLIVLMVRSRACSATIAARSDRGMVTREMSVVRAFMRNMKRTTTTNRAPSSRASFTLSILLSINLDWRYTSVDRCTSEGSDALRSASVLSIWAVRLRVLMLGCLVTVSMTADLPL